MELKDSKADQLARTFLGKKVKVVIDQPIGSMHPDEKTIYKANYGYVPGTLAPDDCELDAYHLGVDGPITEA